MNMCLIPLRAQCQQNMLNLMHGYIYIIYMFDNGSMVVCSIWHSNYTRARTFTGKLVNSHHLIFFQGDDSDVSSSSHLTDSNRLWLHPPPSSRRTAVQLLSPSSSGEYRPNASTYMYSISIIYMRLATDDGKHYYRHFQYPPTIPRIRHFHDPQE